MRRSEGFTLIELLVVIIIIAILASIAIPTYLGTRAKAQDNAAVSLVRNALTAVESANISKRDYTAVTATELTGIESTITWMTSGADLVDSLGPTVNQGSITAEARDNEVNYYPQAADRFDIASRSESGNYYAIEVKTGANSMASYIKVRVVEGSTDVGW